MIQLDRFCCVCIIKRNKLEKLFRDDCLSYYDKLSRLIPQLDIDDVKDVVYICEECIVGIDNMYSFRETCLSNNIKLRRYIKKLRTNKNVDGSKICDFEKNDMAIKSEPNTNQVSPVKELNSDKPLMNNESVNIKFEEVNLPVDDVHINKSSSSEDTTVYENNKMKVVEFSSLHTEIDIKCVKNETCNNEKNVEDNINPSEEDEVDFIPDQSENNKDEDQLPESLDLSNPRNLNSCDPKADCSENEKALNNSFNKPDDPTHHNDTDDKNRYECDKCDESFITHSEFNDHTINNIENPQKCIICNSFFDSVCHLKIHNKTHNAERLKKCKICNKLFNKYYLETHLRAHTGEKPFKCKICNQAFTQMSSVKTHNKIHTGEKSHKCNKCNKFFKNTYVLVEHMRVHRDEKSYVCKVCNRSFRFNSNFRRHIKIHTGEKPYKCETCNKAFINNSHLKNHLRIHTGEKPYKCDVCNKYFSHDSNYTRHIRIHSGEKPYKCHICNKASNSNSDLKKHLRTHSGEKPYKCEICNKNFTNNSNLKQHERTHIKEQP